MLASRPRPRSLVVRAASLLVLLWLLVLAPGAHAEVRKAIWGPVNYGGRSQFPLYRELGVDIYQYPVFWYAVAPERPASPTDPADPAYRWPAELDQAVREAADSGIRVLIRVSQAPAWANGGAPTRVPATRAADYANFLTAVSRRYPTVHLWMVWEEPIRAAVYDLQGQSPVQRARGTALNARQRTQIRKYAEMVDASYAALKRRSPSNRVIGGNTTTTGDVNPELFIRNLRLADGRPPRMDMYGHNPFGTRRPDLRDTPLERGTADFGDLDTLVRWVDGSLNRSGRNRKLPIFISEFTAPTDVASRQWTYHVTRPVQASWLTAGLQVVRRFPRAYDFGWFTLRDVDPRIDPVSGRNGLIDLQGRRKPSFYAFARG